jgi:hypothetical protein
MKITSSKSVVRSVEVRFDIEDIRECLRFTDENGTERPVPSHAIVSRVTPDPENAPNRWEVVATWDEEVDDESEPPGDPLAPVPGTRNANNQGIVLAIFAMHAKGRGLTDAKLVKEAKKLGLGESPAKKARRALTDRGLIQKVGARRARGKTTGQPRTTYKLAGR